MTHLPKIAWISLLAAAYVFCLSPAVTAQNAQIRHVSVVKSGGSIQIQIETSKRVVPLTEVVTDPDRLVIDFADAEPGPELRTVPVNQGEVKAVRVGRVTSNPPVTRVVVDLKSPQSFRLFPSSKSVTVKIGEGAGATSAAAAPSAPPSANVAEAAAAPPPPPPTPRPVLTTRAVNAAPPAPASIAMPAKVPAVRVAPAVMNTAPTLPDAPARSGSGPTAQIRHLAVLKVGGATEIEIETSQRVSPSVQAVTGPDRLVVDFPESLPGPQLRAIPVNQGEVKGVRVGLLTSKPPVTRVVLDLKSPLAYQIFPSAKSVIVKLPASGASMVAALPPGSVSAPNPSTPVPTAPPAPKKVEISFQDGRLRLVSNKASLAEVLNEIRMQLNAEIVVPAGAEQEVVAVALGPATPREVISRLLDGSRYNFIIVGTDADANQVERVVLSPKNNMAESAIAPTPVAEMQGPGAVPPPPVPPPPTEDVQPQGDSNPPPDTTPQPGDPQPAPN
jgi:hypothetical protein